MNLNIIHLEIKYREVEANKKLLLKLIIEAAQGGADIIN